MAITKNEQSNAHDNMSPEHSNFQKERHGIRLIQDII